jgi:hypothetical protein
MSPPKRAAPGTRPSTAQKCVISSKLRDENNIDKGAVNARNLVAATSTRNKSPSSSVEDEGTEHTSERPSDTEQTPDSEQPDGSDDDEVIEVTAQGKRKKQCAHSGRGKVRRIGGRNSSEVEETPEEELGSFLFFWRTRTHIIEYRTYDERMELAYLRILPACSENRGDRFTSLSCFRVLCCCL